MLVSMTKTHRVVRENGMTVSRHGSQALAEKAVRMYAKQEKLAGFEPSIYRVEAYRDMVYSSTGAK